MVEWSKQVAVNTEETQTWGIVTVYSRDISNLGCNNDTSSSHHVITRALFLLNTSQCQKVI